MLTKLAKASLEKTPSITLQSLARELAQLHGLSRATKKQLDHVRSIVESFARIREHEGYSPTLWAAESAVVEIIEWQGIEAFGEGTTWSELSYEAGLGLAQYALQTQPIAST